MNMNGNSSSSNRINEAADNNIRIRRIITVPSSLFAGFRNESTSNNGSNKNTQDQDQYQRQQVGGGTLMLTKALSVLQSSEIGGNYPNSPFFGVSSAFASSSTSSSFTSQSFTTESSRRKQNMA
jgi:hypothetical protein